MRINKYLKMVLFNILVILAFVTKINASTNLTISCPEVVDLGEKINCIVNLKVDSSLYAHGISFNIESLNNGSPKTISDVNEEGYPTNSNINIEVDVPSDLLPGKKYDVKLTNIIVDTINGEEELSNVSTTIRIKSNINSLNSLAVSSASISPTFSSNKLNYTATVNVDSITISATKTNAYSTVTGIGTKTLEYGLNKFEIVVTAENGDKRIYKLEITRKDNRENINTLSSLEVKGYTLNPKFDSQVFMYNLEVENNVSKIKIDATKNGSKSSFVKGYGPREVELKNATTNVLIKILNEQGSERTYTIKVTKKEKVDTRSTNNYLKTLKFDDTEFTFDKTKNIYTFEADMNITKINIDATLEDEKASFVSGYGPREVELKNKKNTFLIKVKSEQGQVREYTLNINKVDRRSTNNYLKQLNISSGFVEFNKEKTEYETIVSNEIKTIQITAIAEDSKAKTEINGPTSLEVGENNFIIKVIAENESIKEYKLKVIRSESVLSNNANVNNIIISGHDFIFDKDIHKYTIETKLDKLNIVVELEDQTAKYNILGNDLLENGNKVQILVFAEDGTRNEYIINVKKEKNNNMLLGIIFGSLTVILFVTFIILYFKRKVENK